MGFEPLREIGKLLLVLGMVLAAVGLLLTLGPKLPFRLGRLPGDNIIIRRDHFTFYFPLATGLLLSVVVSFLFWFFGRR